MLFTENPIDSIILWALPQLPGPDQPTGLDATPEFLEANPARTVADGNHPSVGAARQCLVGFKMNDPAGHGP